MSCITLGCPLHYKYNVAMWELKILYSVTRALKPHQYLFGGGERGGGGKGGGTEREE